MNFSHLENRSLLEISGEDAVDCLDNLVTCNVKNFSPGTASFGALLTPQGKILFDFFISRHNEGFLFDLPAELLDEFIKRLTFYKLRAEVVIEKSSINGTYAVWGEKPSSSRTVVKDPRHEDLGWRVYGDEQPSGTPGDYSALCISLGVPTGGADFQYGDAYPHEVLMDQFGGVDFKKGCYVGQEVVSRMQHRGTTKKRVIKVSTSETLPETGTEITADGKPAGILGSNDGKHGLALIRLDRIAKAQASLANDVEIAAELPDWVTFDWPEA